MKPKLPLRATVPMATAASIQLQHLLLLTSVSVHKNGAGNSLGSAERGCRGAGDQEPSQGSEERWEVRGLCLGSWSRGEPAWGAAEL